jgi:hypothetical protein
LSIRSPMHRACSTSSGVSSSQFTIDWRNIAIPLVEPAGAGELMGRGQDNTHEERTGSTGAQRTGW